MDAEKLGQVLAAFDLLAEEAGGTLTDKPNVADVKAQGVDVDAAERDEAWAAYEAKVAVEAPPEPAGGVAMVTNAFSSTLSVFGVTIPAGGTMPVPAYKADHAVMKAWTKAGVISVA